MTWNEAIKECPIGVLRREIARREQEPIAMDPNAAEALKECTNDFGVTPQQVLAPVRGTDVAAMARRRYAVALRRLGYTNGQIGAHMGNRKSHSISWMLNKHRREQ